jgi:hypothetical protein
MLRAKEHAPTPYPFVVFTSDLHLSLSRSLGVHQWGFHTHFVKYIICGFCHFTTIGGVINIQVFNVAIEVCSLVSIGVGPFYIASFWFFYY